MQKVIKVSGGWMDGRSNGNRTGVVEDGLMVGVGGVEGWAGTGDFGWED